MRTGLKLFFVREKKIMSKEYLDERFVFEYTLHTFETKDKSMQDYKLFLKS